ncbi:MAG: ABC transporter ATP-binding protein [Proteobacteria bacterium]|nr:ABC transporter ATP-binding protein [Pseudomonadota bacterium]
MEPTARETDGRSSAAAGGEPGDAPPAAIRLEDVRRGFRSAGRTVQALAGITANALRGQVTGLVGPDGAGKTTLMRLIAGLLRPDSGRIEALGFDVARDPLDVQARLGYMPQRFGLYEDLTVRENLDLYADLQGVMPERRAPRYADLMHMTGLGPFTARMAGRLSGGMKQKLGLACTLLNPPQLLLLDEPTVGVDPVSRRELWQIIEHLMRETDTAVLFSTAYLDEAERCDQVWLLHEGQLLGSGAPSDFSAEMAGRSFYAVATGGRRALQARLAQTAGVIDAVIQGGHVRVVMAAGAPPEAKMLPDFPDLVLTPTAPRFEDSFVARLGGGRHEAVAAGSRAHSEAGAPALASGDRAAAAGPVITVRQVTRRFGDFTAVDNVSFEVRRGEIFGLLGANGAGKTTTFRMLCGLLPPTQGALEVAGFDLRTAAAIARRRIGYMSQRFSLYGDLTVRQNLNFFSSVYRLTGAHQRARLAWAGEEFALGPMLEAKAGELPLGFKQRLALACALMHDPAILFLDEPTSGVDPLARREFWRRINALAGRGVTVLVTTHFLEEAEYCDRLLIMAQGRVLNEGTPDAIKAAARRPDRPDPTMEEAFIAAIEAAAVPEAA